MRAARGPAAVFAASLLLYLSHRSQYFNFDGVACAIAVELSDFKHLVHGNHLAYGVLGWLFDRALRLLGYQGQALLSLQVLDALLGAAGAAAFTALLRRAGRGEREAVLGGAALAVSHAWWFWSLEAQVYMLGALGAVLAAREALSERPRPAAAGLWLAAAALGHVGHLMAGPALAWRLSRTGGRRALGPFAGALAGALLLSYAAAGLFAVRPASVQELRLWLLGSAALGVDRAFSWHAAPLGDALHAWVRMTARVFCEFVDRPRGAAAAGLLLSLLPLAAAANGVRRGGEAGRFWLAWLAGYAALFLSWEPFTIVYRVSDLAGLWALALLGLPARGERARAAALAAWIAAAGAYNLAFTVRPSADPASNEDLAEARWAGERVPEDAWVLANGRAAVYLPYFVHRKPLNLRYLSAPGALEARLDALAARGEAVYAVDRTLDQTGLLAPAAAYGLEEAAAGGGFRLYRLRRERTAPTRP